MSAILLSLLLSLLFCSIASTESDAGTLRFNFEKRRSTAGIGSATELSKRQSGTVLTQVTNEQLLYLINITVGTPGQPLSLQLDTGSSDTWFPAYTSNICEAGGGYCTLGSFNYNESSTFNVLQSDGAFAIAYVDGSEVQGVYISEVVSIGNATLTNATLALALRADRDVGIMGVGFESAESGNARKNSPFTYPNIVGALKAQGHISTLSYSLWLDDLNADTGSILFGGIDRTKYTGPLVSLPIQNDIQTGRKTSFTVTWSNLTLTNSNPAQSIVLTPSSPQPAILDSGTTLTYLPDAIANSIFSALGVTTNPNIGEILPCKVAANNITFTFTFGGTGGAVISIPVSELLIPLTNENGSPYTGTRSGQGDALCLFGIEAAGNNPILFGDTFLRSAYVVYDLENLQVGLAQLNIQASPAATSSAQPIPATSIPGVASTASAVTVDQTFTGNPLITAGTARSSSGVESTVSRSATLQLTASGTSAFTATAQSQSQTRAGTTSSSGSTGSAKTSGFSVPSSGGSPTDASTASAASAASGSASSATAKAGANGARVELVKSMNVFGFVLCGMAVLGGFVAVVL